VKYVVFIGGFLAALFLAGGIRQAHADVGKAKKEIQAKMKEAMENFDLLEYEEARKLLSQAITIAKKNDLEKDPVIAQVHLRLGIVYFSGLNDPESAKLEFANAVEIDSKVQIEAAYKTAEMVKLLDDTRAEFGNKAAKKPAPAADESEAAPADAPVDCSSVSGIQHTIQDSGDAGKAKNLSAYVGSDISPAKVALMYRSQGATSFTELKMTKQGECEYVGAIPGDAMNGNLVHYYIAAYNKGGKVIAEKGSMGSPNLIEIAGGSATSNGDDENPLAKGGGGGRSSGESGAVSGGVAVAKPDRIFIAIVGGSGGGYVQGKTEQVENDIGCCFAPALLHLAPEIGYYISKQTSISAVFRLGFPIGANRQGHATAAPAGFLRLRYALSPEGGGIAFSGSVGGGFIRNTVKLTNAPDDMNVDTTLMGPLFVGGGAGYIASLGGPIKFLAEVNATMGIPVIDQMGTCPSAPGEVKDASCLQPNFGLEVDANLGLMFGF
jgi:hypothetical protein